MAASQKLRRRRRRRCGGRYPSPRPSAQTSGRGLQRVASQAGTLTGEGEGPFWVTNALALVLVRGEYTVLTVHPTKDLKSVCTFFLPK